MSTVLDPISFTVERFDDRTAADARSVKVTIPISTTLVTGECFYVAPFLGVAMESVTNDGSTTQDIALALGPLVVATTQLTAEQTFAKGTKVYWASGTQKFTETETDIPAGWVYKAKGAEATPVAHIFLMPPSFQPIDLTDLVAIKAAFASIDLTDFDDAVFADINTVAAALADAELTTLGAIEQQSHLPDAAAVTATTVADVASAGGTVADLLTDINKVGGIVARLNTLMTEINATGGIKDTLNKLIKLVEDAGLAASS